MQCANHHLQGPAKTLSATPNPLYMHHSRSHRRLYQDTRTTTALFEPHIPIHIHPFSSDHSQRPSAVIPAVLHPPLSTPVRRAPLLLSRLSTSCHFSTFPRALASIWHLRIQKVIHSAFWSRHYALTRTSTNPVLMSHFLCHAWFSKHCKHITRRLSSLLVSHGAISIRALSTPLLPVNRAQRTASGRRSADQD